jgi:SEC-C motif-containing protein
VRTNRNQPCPCGSGRKFKHCHGGFKQGAQPESGSFAAQALRRHEANERIRQAQQGLGRPIISTKQVDHQVVAVGNKIFWSKAWKTVPDFLSDYMKTTLGPEWGNAEIKEAIR